VPIKHLNKYIFNGFFLSQLSSIFKYSQYRTIRQKKKAIVLSNFLTWNREARSHFCTYILYSFKDMCWYRYIYRCATFYRVKKLHNDKCNDTSLRDIQYGSWFFNRLIFICFSYYHLHKHIIIMIGCLKIKVQAVHKAVFEIFKIWTSCLHEI